MLLVVAIPAASQAASMVGHGYGLLAVFLIVAVAIATPVALDLWAMVHADLAGIRWRNRVLTRALPWSEVAGFEQGSTSMVLRKADGKEVPLRALGLRYFGSKKLAVRRIAVLEDLRRAGTL